MLHQASPTVAWFLQLALLISHIAPTCFTHQFTNSSPLSAGTRSGGSGLARMKGMYCYVTQTVSVFDDSVRPVLTELDLPVSHEVVQTSSPSRVAIAKGPLASITNHFRKLRMTDQDQVIPSKVYKEADPSLLLKLSSAPCELSIKLPIDPEKEKEFVARQVTLLPGFQQERWDMSQIVKELQSSEDMAPVFANWPPTFLDSVDLMQVVSTGYFTVSSTGINPNRFRAITNYGKMVPELGRIRAYCPIRDVTYVNQGLVKEKRVYQTLKIPKAPKNAAEAKDLFVAANAAAECEDLVELVIVNASQLQHWDIQHQGIHWRCKQEFCILEFSLHKDSQLTWLTSYKAQGFLTCFPSITFENGEPKITLVRYEVTAGCICITRQVMSSLCYRPAIEAHKLKPSDPGDASREIPMTASVIRSPIKAMGTGPVAQAKQLKDTAALWVTWRVHQAIMNLPDGKERQLAELAAMQDMQTQLMDFEDVIAGRHDDACTVRIARRELVPILKEGGAFVMKGPGILLILACKVRLCLWNVQFLYATCQLRHATVAADMHQECASLHELLPCEFYRRPSIVIVTESVNGVGQAHVEPIRYNSIHWKVVKDVIMDHEGLVKAMQEVFQVAAQALKDVRDKMKVPVRLELDTSDGNISLLDSIREEEWLPLFKRSVRVKEGFSLAELLQHIDVEELLQLGQDKINLFITIVQEDMVPLVWASAGAAQKAADLATPYLPEERYPQNSTDELRKLLSFPLHATKFRVQSLRVDSVCTVGEKLLRIHLLDLPVHKWKDELEKETTRADRGDIWKLLTEAMKARRTIAAKTVSLTTAPTSAATEILNLMAQLVHEDVGPSLQTQGLKDNPAYAALKSKTSKTATGTMALTGDDMQTDNGEHTTVLYSHTCTYLTNTLYTGDEVTSPGQPPVLDLSKPSPPPKEEAEKRKAELRQNLKPKKVKSAVPYIQVNTSAQCLSYSLVILVLNVYMVPMPHHSLTQKPSSRSASLWTLQAAQQEGTSCQQYSLESTLVIPSEQKAQVYTQQIHHPKLQLHTLFQNVACTASCISTSFTTILHTLTDPGSSVLDAGESCGHTTNGVKEWQPQQQMEGRNTCVNSDHLVSRCWTSKQWCWEIMRTLQSSVLFQSSCLDKQLQYWSALQLGWIHHSSRSSSTAIGTGRGQEDCTCAVIRSVVLCLGHRNSSAAVELAIVMDPWRNWFLQQSHLATQTPEYLTSHTCPYLFSPVQPSLLSFVKNRKVKHCSHRHLTLIGHMPWIGTPPPQTRLLHSSKNKLSHYAQFLCKLLLLGGDIEENPGPSFNFGISTLQMETELRTLKRLLNTKVPTEQLQQSAQAIWNNLPPLKPATYPLNNMNNHNLRKMGWDKAMIHNIQQYMGHIFPLFPQQLHSPTSDSQAIHYLDTIGDGNCFFRSLSISLYGTQDYHLYVRHRVGLYSVLHACANTAVPITPGIRRNLMEICTPFAWMWIEVANVVALLWNCNILVSYPEALVKTNPDTCKINVHLYGYSIPSTGPSTNSISLSWTAMGDRTGQAPKRRACNHFIPMHFTDPHMLNQLVQHLSLQPSSVVQPLPQGPNSIPLHTLVQGRHIAPHLTSTPDKTLYPRNEEEDSPLLLPRQQTEEWTTVCRKKYYRKILTSPTPEKTTAQMQEPAAPPSKMRAHSDPPPNNQPAKDASVPNKTAEHPYFFTSKPKPVVKQKSRKRSWGTQQPITAYLTKPMVTLPPIREPTPMPESSPHIKPLPESNLPPLQPSLHCSTWNIRGMGQYSAILEELAQFSLTQEPDVMILTETKLLNTACKRKKALQGALEGYHLWHGYAHKTHTDHPAGGVSLAIKKTLSLHHGARPLSTPPALRPYVLPVLVASNTHAHGIMVVAAYLPPGNPTLRTQISTHLTTLIHTHPNMPLILMGDMNTGFTETDYNPPSRNNIDSTFCSWMLQHELLPCSYHSFTYEEIRENQPIYQSRIDHILLNPPAQPSLPTLSTAMVHSKYVSSDHIPLSCWLDNTFLAIPTQPIQDSSYSASSHTKNSLKGLCFMTIKQKLNTPNLRLDTMAHKYTNICNQWLNAAPDNQQLEDMADNITKLYLDLQTLVQDKDSSPRYTYKHWTRTQSRALKKVLNSIHTTKEQLKATPYQSQIWQDTYSQLQAHKKEVRTILKQERIETMKRLEEKDIKLYASNRKQLHKQLFQTTPDSEVTWKNLEAVRHPTTGHLRTDGAGIKDAILTHFGNLVCPQHIAPPLGTPPWELPTSPDPMKLHKPPHEDPDSLQSLIFDKMGFFTQLHHLSKGKATGPDGLANEILSGAPPNYKTLLHAFMCCLWQARYTPIIWSQSHTYLLHKKGDVCDLANYRPIAMANTLGKVWTGHLARALSIYAESKGIISSTQEGFRPRKNSHRQIRNIINAIEDALLHNKDIYLLFVDFSNAFNMVDHNTLNTILEWIGIPGAMRQCISSLYANASTRFITPAGLTDSISITRGTLQGDTLSPLLFLLYIEPLLRWLHQGGRGYQYGCLTTPENAQHRLSSGAYADDLAAVSTSIGDLSIQANKITLFAKWAGLGINNNKCASTGARFSTWKQGGTIQTYLQDDTVQKKLAGNVTLGGLPIPALLPGESYTYLGIPLNMGLNWKEALTTLLAKMKKKLQTITQSTSLPPSIKNNIINETVTSMVDYHLAVHPFAPKDMHLINSTIAVAKRKVLKLPSYFPTHDLLNPPQHGGLGTGDIGQRLLRMSAQQLTMCLNDPGRLGLVTRHLIHKQAEKWAHHPEMELPTLTTIGTHTLGLKQILLLHKCGLHILHEDKPLVPTSWLTNPLVKDTIQSLTMQEDWHPPLSTKTAHPALPTQWLHPASRLRVVQQATHLWKLKIHTLTDLLSYESSPPTFLTPQEMKLRWGTRGPTPLKALHYFSTAWHWVQLHHLVHTCVQDSPPRTPHEDVAHFLSPPTLSTHPTWKYWPRTLKRITTVDRPFTVSKRSKHGWDPLPTTARTDDVCWICDQFIDLEDNTCFSSCAHCHHCTAHDMCLSHQLVICPGCAPLLSLAAQHWCHALYTYQSQAHHDRDHNEQLEAPQTGQPSLLSTWEDLREYAMSPVSSQDSYLYFALYNQQDRVQSILDRWHHQDYLVPTYSKVQGKKQRISTGITSKITVQVAWQPTYILAHHLPNAERLGYHPARILDTYTSPHLLPNDVPPILADVVSPQLPLLKVDWEHSEEAEAQLEEADPQHYNHLRTQYLQHTASHNDPYWSLTHAQQQGCWEDTTTPQSITSLLHNNLTITLDPIHPDWDIAPTPVATVHPHPTCPETTLSFAPQGLYQGCIPTDVYTWHQTRTDSPPDIFNHSLSTMISSTLRKLTSPQKHLLGVRPPPPLLRALLTIQPRWTQQATTYLAVEPQCTSHTVIPGDSTTWPHSGPWNTQIWQGWNIVAPPPHKPTITKLLRWAISSSQSPGTSPYLAYFLLPNKLKLYQPWTEHHEVGHFLTFKPHSLPISRGVAHESNNIWKTSGSSTGYVLLVVANALGATWHSTVAHPVLTSILAPYIRRVEIMTQWRVDKGRDPRFSFLTPNRFIRLLQSTSPDKAPIATPAQCPLTPLPYPGPRWNTDKIYYTDGSSLKVDGVTQCGAGVYNASLGLRLRVNPNGEGPTDTINRGELSGIHAALQDIETRKPEEAHCLTDSTCSEWQTHRVCHNPASLAWHTHRHLLHDIQSLLLKITPHTKLTIGKVKAHIGVKGNEEADLLAGTAARDSSRCTHVSPSHPSPHASLYWVHKTTDTGSKPVTNNSQITILTPHLDYRPPGIYKRSWERVTPWLDKKTWDLLAKSNLPFSIKKTLWKYKGGALYNNKLGKRMGHCSTSLCPLCNQEDSAGHMLGECHHDHLKGLHCQRHDNTVYRLCKLLRNSKDPSISRSLLQADAQASYGKLLRDTDHLPALPRLEEGHESVLPEWLLPSLSDEERKKLRPDILCMAIDSTHTLDGEDYLEVIKKHATFHILEVGYGGDTFYHLTKERKMQQHAHLINLLRQEGWKVQGTDPIIFGHGGSIYKDTKDVLTNKYQVPHHLVRAFLSKTQREAAHYAHQIVVTRRYLEKKGKKL